MQVINYSLQRREHAGLSAVLDGIVQTGEYQAPNNVHAIALNRVVLGASMKDIANTAELLPFSVDTICRGALIYAIIGFITPTEFRLIADRSGGNVFNNLLIQFPELLKDS